MSARKEQGGRDGRRKGAADADNALVPIIRPHLHPGALEYKLNLPQRAGGVALHHGERKAQVFEAVLIERRHRREYAPDARVARSNVVEVDARKGARRQLKGAHEAWGVAAIHLTRTHTGAVVRSAVCAATTGAETPLPRCGESFLPARFELIGVGRVADKRPADNLLQKRAREASECVLALEENLPKDTTSEAEAFAARLAAQRSGAHGVVTQRRIRCRRLGDRQVKPFARRSVCRGRRDGGRGS